MGNRILPILLTSLLLLYTNALVASETNYPVSVEEAIQIARDWAGNPELELTLFDISADRLYVLRTQDKEEFNVDCYSGAMKWWRNLPAMSAYFQKLKQDDPSLKLPVNELNDIVTAFLRAKYPDFDALNMQRIHPQSPYSRYVQQLPNGVWNWNYVVSCSIDEWTGEVVQYLGFHGSPPSIPVDPIVSLQQAEDIALNHSFTFNIENDFREDPVFPQSAFIIDNDDGRVSVGKDDLGVERLRRGFAVIVHEDENYTPLDYYQELSEPLGVPSSAELEIGVDALTGEVFYCEYGGYLGPPQRSFDIQIAKSIQSRKPDPSVPKKQPRYERAELEIEGKTMYDLLFPPLVFGDTCYLYAKYLPLLYGGDIQWANRKAEMNLAGRRVILRPGRAIEMDGENLTSSHAPIVIADRIYVPHQAIKDVCGAVVSWDQENKVLSIRSGNTLIKASSLRVR